jgi:hypothetical protein
MKRSFFLTITSLLCTTLPVYSETLPVQNAQGQHDRSARHYPVGHSAAQEAVEVSLIPITRRAETRCFNSSDGAFGYQLRKAILGSVPADSDNVSAIDQEIATVVKFNLDQDGRISNWKITTSSGAVAKDFWTVYAVASCPPMGYRLGPDNSQVENYGVTTGSDPEEENWRINLRSQIQSVKGAKSVFFPLIPVSFITRFPGTVSLADICTKKNLVGISVSNLTGSDSEKGIITQKFIESDSQISSFLKEWQSFFSSTPTPTKAQIDEFAEGLKIKYKDLLEEVEPLAPLP